MAAGGREFQRGLVTDRGRRPCFEHRGGGALEGGILGRFGVLRGGRSFFRAGAVWRVGVLAAVLIGVTVASGGTSVASAGPAAATQIYWTDSNLEWDGVGGDLAGQSRREQRHAGGDPCGSEHGVSRLRFGRGTVLLGRLQRREFLWERSTRERRRERGRGHRADYVGAARG